jgi:hypothetical protein
MGGQAIVSEVLTSVGQFLIMIVLMFVLIKAGKVLDSIAEMIKKNID